MNNNELAKRIAANQYNPQNIFHDGLVALNDNGFQIADATTPLATLFEFASVLTANSNDQLDRLYKLGTPEYATNIDELSMHFDYTQLETIHAKPAIRTFNVLLPIHELWEQCIKVSAGVRKLTIPREMTITYDNSIVYSMFHDIELTMHGHDTLDAVYIANSNPLYPLTRPAVPVRYRAKPTGNDPTEDDAGAVMWVELTIDMYQTDMSSELFPVTETTGFNELFPITDQLFHVRVYNLLGGKWAELKTAFSEFAYAPNGLPTAVIRLVDDSVSVMIPQVYFTNKQIISDIKVEVLTTKGGANIPQINSTVDNYKVGMHNTNALLRDSVARLSNLSSIHAFGEADYVAGKDIPSFDKLQKSIMVGQVDNKALTFASLSNYLSTMDYHLIHERNYLTENLYVATKKLPTFKKGDVETMITAGSLNIRLNNLNVAHGIIRNGNSYTITPEAIVYSNGSSSEFMTSAEVAKLSPGAHKTQETYINDVNTGNYSVTPFYYVLEELTFNKRISAISLNNPRIVETIFMGTAPVAEGVISTTAVLIDVVSNSVLGKGDGVTYTIDLVASVSSAYKDLPDTAFDAQLSYKASTGGLYSLTTSSYARLSDGGFRYRFELTSTCDLSGDGTIVLDDLLDPATGLAGIVNLSDTFNLTYSLVSPVPTLKDATFDAFVQASQLSSQSYLTTSHELVEIEFGKVLDLLYTPKTTYKGAVEFKRHIADKPLLYKEDVDKIDPITHDSEILVNPHYDASLPIDATNQPLTITVEHAAGTPVLDSKGNPVMEYSVGDIVIDSNTLKPSVVNRGDAEIEVGLVLIDYLFYVVDEIPAIHDVMVDAMEHDLRPIATNTVDLAQLKYSVTSAIGSAIVKFNSKKSSSISNAVSVELELVIDAVTYSDLKARARIEKLTKSTIVQYMVDDYEFSINKLTSLLHTSIGADVIGFRIISIDGLTDVISFTPTEVDEVFGVKSVLIVDDTGKYAVTDGISISFIKD